MPLRRPTLGASAPSVTFRDTEGDEWRLTDHRGHPVVLIFHRHIH